MIADDAVISTSRTHYRGLHTICGYGVRRSVGLRVDDQRPAHQALGLCQSAWVCDEVGSNAMTPGKRVLGCVMASNAHQASGETKRTVAGVPATFGCIRRMPAFS